MESYYGSQHLLKVVFFFILSTWTFMRPPTYPTWTNVDIWLTTHPPLLVHVVKVWPPSSK